MTKLNEFTAWEERSLADVRRATPAQLKHGFEAILSAQAPMQALSLFQTYAKASGVQKIVASVRKRLERELLLMEKSGAFVIEREMDDPEANDEGDSVCWIVRLPDQPRTRLRTLGDRGFAEIPLSELAELALEIKTEDEMMGREDITRNILSVYGLQKKTALVDRRMAAVFARF